MFKSCKKWGCVQFRESVLIVFDDIVVKPWSCIFQHLSIAVNRISRGTNKRYNRNPVCMALQLSEDQSYINLVCERVLCVLPIVTVNVILFLFRKDTIGKSEVKNTFSAALSAAFKNGRLLSMLSCTTSLI